MSQSKVSCRWALLGLSNIAKQFVDDILLPRHETDLISHEVVCVSTTGTVDRAASWLRERSNANTEDVKIFTSADEMLRLGDFDVVYISTPHPLHYSLTRAAIHHGRNVLVEKPATMNRAQFEELSNLAKKANVVLMEAMWTRYLPAVQYLEGDLLPKIGKVKRVFADLSVPIVSEDMPLNSRLLDKGAGAGAMLDMGVYALTWVDIAFGRSSASKVVFSHTIPHDTGRDLIDDINTTIIDSDGRVAIATTSLTLAGSSKVDNKLAVKKVAPDVRIEATNAQVSIPFPLIRPETLHIEWYNEENVGEDGMAKHEIVTKEIERGWGLWYQADVIAGALINRKGHSTASSSSGLVIGEDDSLRILGWMDVARKMSGIVYNDAMEAV